MNDEFAEWFRLNLPTKISRRVRLRIRNDVVCVRDALRPTALIDAFTLRPNAQQSLLLQCQKSSVLVVICAHGGDFVFVANRDALLRCVRDDALFLAMRTVDVDTFEVSSLIDRIALLPTIRAHLQTALEAAEHGDVIELPDWNLYPPTLIGLMLLYPVVFARTNDIDWQNDTAINMHALRLVRVHVEHENLVYAPSPGELQLERGGGESVSVRHRGNVLWSFSIPASLAIDDNEFLTHFRALIDRERVRDDQIEVSQIAVSNDALTL
jgi:hypothetical protein